MDFEYKDSYTINDLLKIMHALRSPGGCPWDREQTHASIRKNFIEETYEVCEAIDNDDAVLLCEELGDVLLQIVFHTEMEHERGSFTFDDVCNGICQKLILRHPHVFGEVSASTPEEVLRNWDAIKKQEKGQATYTQTLQSVPRTLPALMRSEKVQGRAAKAGFDYPDTAGALEGLRSEVDELSEAIQNGEAEAIADELGDVLFSATNVARFASIDSEHALERSCDKFVGRFEKVERLAADRGVDMRQAGFDALNDLWREVKK